MKRSLVGFALGFVVVACGSDPPPEARSPAAAPPPVETTPPIATAAPPPEPTPEEKKRDEARRALEADRAKMLAAHEAELGRWTPELKAEAKALVEKSFPSGRAAMQAVTASKHRKPAAVARDKFRHPIETMEFFGFKPNMTVFEYGPGEGWYTELLAPALAKSGKLVVNSADPSGPPEERSTFYGHRLKLALETSPELYGKVDTIIVRGDSPTLGSGIENKVDLALVIRGLHGMVNGGTLDAWLAEIHRALKPNGVLGVVQHRARADVDAVASAKTGYLPEKFVIDRVMAAGFKLAGKSEINANPKDTKDHPKGVWALPPTFELGDTDRAKYAAIGESDRMTLKFVKAAAKPVSPKGAPAP